MDRNQKEAILGNALELFAKNGYNNTSTDKIISAAKVSKGLLFYHFKNKESLLTEIIRKELEKLSTIFNIDHLDLSAKEKLSLVLDKYFESLKTNYDFWKLYTFLSMEEGLNEKICSMNFDFQEKYSEISQQLFKAIFQEQYQEKLFEFEIMRNGAFHLYITKKDDNQLVLMKNQLIRMFCS